MKMELRSKKRDYNPLDLFRRSGWRGVKALIFMRIILYFDSIKIVFTRPIRTVYPFYKDFKFSKNFIFTITPK